MSLSPSLLSLARRSLHRGAVALLLAHLCSGCAGTLAQQAPANAPLSCAMLVSGEDSDSCAIARNGRRLVSVSVSVSGDLSSVLGGSAAADDTSAASSDSGGSSSSDEGDDEGGDDEGGDE